MGIIAKVTVKDHDALTDLNTNDFTLDVDEDDVLIKEFKRGSISIKSAEQVNIDHNLGYIPIVMVFVNEDASHFGVTGWATPRMASPTDLPLIYTSVTSSHLNITANSDSTPIEVKYHIFYDRQVS